MFQNIHFHCIKQKTGSPLPPSINVEPRNSSPCKCLARWCDIVIGEMGRRKEKTSIQGGTNTYSCLMCPCALIQRTGCLVNAVDNMSKSTISLAYPQCVYTYCVINKMFSTYLDKYCSGQASIDTVKRLP